MIANMKVVSDILAFNVLSKIIIFLFASDTKKREKRRKKCGKHLASAKCQFSWKNNKNYPHLRPFHGFPRIFIRITVITLSIGTTRSMQIV